MSTLKPLSQLFEFKEGIPPTNYTAAITGSEINGSNALRFVTICVQVGAVNTLDASNYFTVTVNQATSSGGSFAAIESAQYVNVANSWDRVLNASGDANTMHRFDIELKPGYPYLKIMVAKTLGSPDCDLSGFAVFACKRTPTT